MTLDDIKQIVAYDPKTGQFTRNWAGYGRSIGDVVGNIAKDGYVYIPVKGTNFLAHRLAWLFIHGLWPVEDIDHMDRNKANNCAANLCAVSRGENLQNMIMPKHNTSGYIGASKRKDGRWLSQLVVDRQHIHLGVYDTPLEAHLAYSKAKKQYHKYHNTV